MAKKKFDQTIFFFFLMFLKKFLTEKEKLLSKKNIFAKENIDKKFFFKLKKLSTSLQHLSFILVKKISETSSHIFTATTWKHKIHSDFLCPNSDIFSILWKISKGWNENEIRYIRVSPWLVLEKKPNNSICYFHSKIMNSQNPLLGTTLKIACRHTHPYLLQKILYLTRAESAYSHTWPKAASTPMFS